LKQGLKSAFKKKSFFPKLVYRIVRQTQIRENATGTILFFGRVNDPSL